VAERCGVEGDLAGPAVCIFNEPRDTVPYTQACTDPMHSASQPHTYTIPALWGACVLITIYGRTTFGSTPSWWPSG